MGIIKHLGDITKLNGAGIPVVDVITGGSPCQDLSVAGKRAGMKHESHGDDETTRSGLFMDQIRLVKEMRENDRRSGRTGESVRPRYMVWENVPGAFSSNHGRDFQAVLEEIIKVAEPDAPGVPLPEAGRWSKSGCICDELGKWSVAWRLHDAQFFGVPQRRKRIALLADFGGSTAPWIMFDPKLERTTEDGYPDETELGSGAESRSEVQPIGKSVSGHSEPCGEARQETAGSSGSGFEGAGIGVNNSAPETICLEGNGSRDSHFGNGYSESDVMYTLNTIEQHGVLPVAVDVYNQTIDGDVTATVTANVGVPNHSGPKVMTQEPIVLESNQNHATITDNGVSPTLSASMGMGGGYVPMVTERHSISFQERAGNPGGGKGILIQDEHIGALSTLQIQHVFSLETYHCEHDDETAMTLKARDYKDPQSVLCVPGDEADG